MSDITQEKFINELKTQWEITNIKIIEEAKTKFGDSQKKYSIEHYLILKNAIIQHLSLLDNNRKKAYINRKKNNYKSLDDPSSRDFLISVLTGGVLFSFFDKEIIKINGPIITIVLLIVLAVLIYLKCSIITNQKYKFVLSILEDIENEKNINKWRKSIMNLTEAIELGKEKVLYGHMKSGFNDLTNKFFEIIGYTDANYFGTILSNDIKIKYENENMFYEMKFYKYNNQDLSECKLEDAFCTLEYMTDKVFIFSQIEDEDRQYYVAKIVDDENTNS